MMEIKDEFLQIVKVKVKSLSRLFVIPWTVA